MVSARTSGIEKRSVPNGLRPVAISVLIGAAATVALLLFFAFIMTVRDIPQFAVGPMAAAALVGGAFTSGFACAKITHENGLLHGAFCGIIFVLVVFLASFALHDNGFGVPAIFKTVYVMFGAMLGGVAGVNPGKRQRAAVPSLRGKTY